VNNCPTHRTPLSCCLPRARSSTGLAAMILRRQCWLSEAAAAASTLGCVAATPPVTPAGCRAWGCAPFSRPDSLGVGYLGAHHEPIGPVQPVTRGEHEAAQAIDQQPQRVEVEHPRKMAHRVERVHPCARGVLGIPAATLSTAARAHRQARTHPISQRLSRVKWRSVVWAAAAADGWRWASYCTRPYLSSDP
jgi:hypothetical protein